MITLEELSINHKSIAEIAAIRGNTLLSFQVLIIIGLIDQGHFPPVEITIKKDSKIIGEIIMCSGYSFTVANQDGGMGNIRFTDIDKLQIKKGA